MKNLCKKCKKEITSGSKSGLCGSCCKKNRLVSKQTRDRISKANLGKVRSIEAKKRYSLSKIGISRSKETIEKIRSSKIGVRPSIETRLKLSEARIGIKNPMFGKKRLDMIGNKNPAKKLEVRKKISNSKMGKRRNLETKQKIRITRLKKISNDFFNGHQVIPNWNPIACQKIDEYGKSNGYNFQHAMNGGEFFIKDLGYFVDGYDKEKNTVIEYYEKQHNNQVQKDFDRETEICSHLNCDFIILWEN